MIFQAVCTVLCDLLESVSQFFIRESTAAGKQFAKISKYLLDRLDILLGAIDQQFIAACTDTDIEQRFEKFNILVLNAE